MSMSLIFSLCLNSTISLISSPSVNFSLSLNSMMSRQKEAVLIKDTRQNFFCGAALSGKRHDKKRSVTRRRTGCTTHKVEDAKFVSSCLSWPSSASPHLSLLLAKSGVSENTLDRDASKCNLLGLIINSLLTSTDGCSPCLLGAYIIFRIASRTEFLLDE
ncbi:unnamed protein product, partial [Nesidiocoris tenuis]